MVHGNHNHNYQYVRQQIDRSNSSHHKSKSDIGSSMKSLDNREGHGPNVSQGCEFTEAYQHANHMFKTKKAHNLNTTPQRMMPKVKKPSVKGLDRHTKSHSKKRKMEEKRRKGSSQSSDKSKQAGRTTSYRSQGLPGCDSMRGKKKPY